MPEHTPEYSHVTLLNGPGAIVVRVHSTNPLFDFYLARDHGSNVIEAACSIIGAAAGEVSVRFDKKDGNPVAVLDRSGWRPATPDDQRAVDAAYGRYAIARKLLALLTDQ